MAAMTQLQPGQKELATRGLGAALRALLFRQGERQSLGEIDRRESAGGHWSVSCLHNKGADPWSEEGSGKAGTA